MLSVLDLRWAAIILTGGRGARLGGYQKANLVASDGETTLGRAVAACVGARPIVAVGPPTGDAPVIWTRETPAYSGPARGIAAGVTALADSDVSWVAVLACDMPQAGPAVPALLQRARDADDATDGVVAMSGGHRQWLCAAYRLAPLRAACDGLPAGGAGESVGRLLRGLRLAELIVPESWATDIDTPADLARTGFSTTMPITEEGCP